MEIVIGVGLGILVVVTTIGITAYFVMNERSEYFAE